MRIGTTQLFMLLSETVYERMYTYSCAYKWTYVIHNLLSLYIYIYIIHQWKSRDTHLRMLSAQFYKIALTLCNSVDTTHILSAFTWRYRGQWKFYLFFFYCYWSEISKIVFIFYSKDHSVPGMVLHDCNLLGRWWLGG
jgi:hypothetical protein